MHRQEARVALAPKATITVNESERNVVFDIGTLIDIEERLEKTPPQVLEQIDAWRIVVTPGGKDAQGKDLPAKFDLDQASRAMALFSPKFAVGFIAACMGCGPGDLTKQIRLEEIQPAFWTLITAFTDAIVAMSPKAKDSEKANEPKPATIEADADPTTARGASST